MPKDSLKSKQTLSLNEAKRKIMDLMAISDRSEKQRPYCHQRKISRPWLETVQIEPEIELEKATQAIENKFNNLKC
jgi:hypothetical protein